MVDLLDANMAILQRSLDSIQAREDEPGILKSQAYFHSLIASEVEKGIPSERIVLGGFSQGGAMSLLSGVTCPQKIGGIFGLSCYLLLQGKIKDMIPAENPNKDTPIFMGHGDEDEVVQYKWGKLTAEKLNEWGWTVDFKTYSYVKFDAIWRLHNSYLCKDVNHCQRSMLTVF
jgi:predicted esterase